MSTRDEVANLAGVSPATVSHVINKTKYVSPELRIKVEQAVEELNYKPNIIARSLATKQTKHVGLLVDNIINPYYGEIAQGMEEIAYKNGYVVSLYLANGKPYEYINSIIERQLDGLFIATTNYSLCISDFKRIADNNIAIVSSQSNDYCSTISFDYATAVDKALQYLIDLGHRKIAFIAGDINKRLDDPRYIQYKKSLEKNGIEFNESLVSDSDYSFDTHTSGDDAMKKLLALETGVTAVFCLNDMLAFGAVKAIKEAGLSVPQDISVIGCDDIFFTECMAPELTTLRAPKKEMGRQAMTFILNKIREDKYSKLMLNVDLVIRESTGKCID